MADEKLEIVISAKDETGGALGALAVTVGNLASAAIQKGLQLVGAGIQGIGSAFGTMIQEAMAAEEVMAQLDSVLKSMGETSTITINQMTEEAKKKVDDLVDKIADKNGEILKLDEELAESRRKIEDDLGRDLAQINERAAENISKIEETLNERLSDIAKKQADLQRDFQAELVKISENATADIIAAEQQHADKVADLRASLDTLESEFAYDKAEREEDVTRTLTRMNEDYTHNREGLVKQLEAAETDAEKARIQARIDEMDYEYNLKKKRTEEDAAERESDLKREHEQRIAAVNARIAEEDAALQAQTAKIREEETKRLQEATAKAAERGAVLAEQIAEANAEYEKETAKVIEERKKQEVEIRASHARQIADVQKRYADELAEIDKFVAEAQGKIDALTTEPVAVEVVRPTKEAILELADSLSQITRFSDDAILSAQTIALTFGNIGADVFPDVTMAILDMSTKMGGDLQGAAVMIGKALNDPVNMLQSLTRNGVTFTEEQKQMIESLWASGDAAGAQKIVLGELNREFGGSAVAAGQTFAGQMDIIKNNLLNTAESIGMELLPQLKEMAAQLITFVQSDTFKGWVNDVITWLRDGLPEAMQKAKDFWNNTLKPALDEWTPILRDDILPALGEIGDFLGVILPPAFDAMGKAVAVMAWIFENILLPPIRSTIDGFKQAYDWSLKMAEIGGLNPTTAKGQSNLSGVAGGIGLIGGLANPVAGLSLLAGQGVAGALSSMTNSNNTTTVNVQAGAVMSMMDQNGLEAWLKPILQQWFPELAN